MFEYNTWLYAIALQPSAHSQMTKGHFLDPRKNTEKVFAQNCTERNMEGL